MNSLYICMLVGLLVGMTDEDDPRLAKRLKDRVQRREYLDGIEEITFNDRRKENATVRYYTKDGRRLSEEHYSNYQLRVKHGRTQFWYPNGQLHWACDFNNNQINGPFFSYYTDGTLKRKELYKWGYVKSGQCYSPEGERIECEPFIQRADFPGGRDKFLAFLRDRLKHVKPAQTPAFVTLEGNVWVDGTAYLKRVAPDRELFHQVADSIGIMPAWKPAKVDGVPVQSGFQVILSFREGTVFMYDY